MPIDEGGTKATDVVAYRLGDQTEILIGQAYELRGSAIFETDETVDGGAEYTGKIWSVIQDHFGVVPFWYRMDYDMIVLSQNGGRHKWFIHSFACQFIPVKSESIIGSIIIALGLAIAAIVSAYVISQGFVFYILKPAGAFAGGFGGVLVVFGILVLIGMLGFAFISRRK